MIKLRKKDKEPVQKPKVEECGMGDVCPASTAAMTAADQASANCIGSGDNFGMNILPVSVKKPILLKKKNKRKS